MVLHRRRFNAHIKRNIAAAQSWRCYMCGEMLDALYEVDHRVPLHMGGADELDNMFAACSTCHREKTQREEIERLARADAARRARTRGVLVCSRCEARVSPYFMHVCGGGGGGG